MALGSKMYDAVNLLVLHELVESVEVADVHLDKLVVRLVLDILKVGEVASIGELVEVDDVILWVFVHEEAHHMASNEACTACNYYIFHLVINISCQNVSV